MSKVAGQVRDVTVDIYRASAPVKEKVRSSIRTAAASQIMDLRRTRGGEEREEEEEE
jgi:hypothetical protein